ncbi:DUF5753 domain-containing protein [Streptomyces cellulosae]|uniref:DUF5753 domain-containing protein n=1 Tax=Streptomyces cellulosae TaxID=1968 RepID=A0ABW6JLX4_STRCE
MYVKEWTWAAACSDEQVDGLVEARLARQRVSAEQPAPMFDFVQEEVTLRRPLGGKMVMRKQLEHLLEVGRRRNMDIQVLPTNREDHAGLAGALQLLRLKEGPTVGRVEVQLFNRLISDPKGRQILEIRHGIIRAQALTPRESLAFIEKVLGET